jgi:hypothetical protein
MRVKAALILVGIVFLFLLAGCTVQTAHAPEAQAEATATPAPTATYEPNTAVIFKRSGGIAGVDEQWVLFLDGRIQTSNSIQPQLSAEEVNQLLDSLETVGFFELNNSYLPEDSCCDRFLYEITALQNSTFHSVTTLENTPDMPEPLQQSLRLVQNALFENNNE